VATVSTRPHPHIDRIVPIAEVAKGWPIWLTVAGAISLTGEDGRRTAAHAVSAAVASSLLGQVVKRGVQRSRPRRVPLPRPAAHGRPTYSFPSGHAATGAAFATTVVLERGVVGTPLLGLAAVVGYTRVYGAVHFVTDVLGGALLGTGVAVGFWAVRRHREQGRTPTDAALTDTLPTDTASTGAEPTRTVPTPA
jgi:membrane-associated phospholipid phosphatase